MTVVDASVLVAAHSEREPGFEVSQNWLEGALHGELASPTIVLSEGAIARSTGNAALAERVVRRLTDSPLTFVPVDESLAIEAAAIARTQRIRGCDAIYVALARRLDRPLITLDREQLARGAAVAVVRRPHEPGPR